MFDPDTGATCQEGEVQDGGAQPQVPAEGAVVGQELQGGHVHVPDSSDSAQQEWVQTEGGHPRQNEPG